MRWRLVLVSLSGFFLSHSLVHGFSFGQERVNLVLSPDYPQAEATVTARLDDYSIPVPTVGIAWYLDGQLVPEAMNQRQFVFKTGPIGSKTTVSVVATLSNEAKVSAERVIEPSFVDLIIEAQTRTPAFYHGRALPSLGSQVNVIAITAIDEIIPPQNLVYTWRLNNQVIGGGALRGRNSVSFTMPMGQYATLALEVSRPNEPPLARKIIDIPNFSPELAFYEISPLYGLIRSAVERELVLIGNAITMRAEPYYLDLNTYNRPDLVEWRVDNRVVVNPSSNPYELPLEMRSGGGGSSRINFHVRNTTVVLQGVRGEFSLRY